MWEVRKGTQDESWVPICTALATIGIKGQVLGSIWGDIHISGQCKTGSGVKMGG